MSDQDFKWLGAYWLLVIMSDFSFYGYNLEDTSHNENLSVCTISERKYKKLETTEE